MSTKVDFIQINRFFVKANHEFQEEFSPQWVETSTIRMKTPGLRERQNEAVIEKSRF